MRNYFKSFLIIIFPLIINFFSVIAEFYLLNWFYPFFETDIFTVYSAIFILFFNIMLVYPLKIGKKRCFYKLYQNNILSFYDEFYYFSSFKLYFSAISVMLTKLIYLSALVVLLITPSAFIFNFLSKYENTQTYQMLTVLLFLIAIVILAVNYFSLFLMDYLFIDKECNPFKTFFLSFKMMKSNKVELFELYFKLIAILLSCVFIIPIFYVLPLFNQTTAVFADKVIFQNQTYLQMSLWGNKTSSASAP